MRLIQLILVIKIGVSVGTETIEVPPDFCELDKRSECKHNQCIRYDPKKFKESPSIVTYFPGGRLGNMISAYLFLLWVSMDSGLDVFYEKKSHKILSHYFQNIDIPALEDKLCDWRQFPFKKYEGNVELLGAPEWKVGHAIEIYIAKSNFLRQEIQGGRKYYKQYKKESMHALTFRKPFQDHANKILSNVASKVKKAMNKKKRKNAELTFVGIHNRRTDYLDFRKNRLSLENLYEDYFQDAMEYFRDEYDNTVFLYVSDDMQWGEENLGKENNIFFVGCGQEELDCIGKDLAVLANCNHTVTTHGSFGHWASYMAGGEVYTEYGPIVP